VRIKYCGIVYYLPGVHKEFKIIRNYIYISHVCQKWLKVCTGIKHILVKVEIYICKLACRYLNNLNHLGRYCVLLLKIVISCSHYKLELEC